MKTTSKLIAAMLCACGTQLISSEKATSSKTIARGLTKAGRVTWRGFQSVMTSGIDFEELHRKIQERHQLNGYKGVSETKIPLISSE